MGPWVISNGALLIPWNSMEWYTELQRIMMLIKVIRDSIELGYVLIFRPHNSMEFHEICDIPFGDTRVPWNFMEYSMEFHGILCHVTFHGTSIVSWNSMELLLWLWQFHGIPWNFGWGPKFHGISKLPWNSMELHNWVWGFHGILWNSMKFGYVAKFPGTFKIPWKSIELIF